MFVILFVMCAACAIANGVLQNQALSFAYLQPFDGASTSPAASGVISFFTYLILLSGIVPLPLYVSLELVSGDETRFGLHILIDEVCKGQSCPCGLDRLGC